MGQGAPHRRQDRLEPAGRPRRSGELNAAWLDSLADDVAALAKAGKQVIVVSSGAIALGRHVLGFAKGALELEKSQAAAAVGQISLAGAYQAVFKARGLAAAQILLTLGDTEERRRYLNARQTIDTLLAAARHPRRQRERHGGHQPRSATATTTACPPASPA